MLHSHTHTERNNNTKHSPSKTNYHPPTHKQSTKGQKHRHTSNQHKRHQKQIEELKNLVHSTQLDIITIQGTKLTQKAKTPKIHHHTYAQTGSKNKEGDHHTDQGRHNLHTQHRTTTDQNTHRKDQRHSSKHILSTKRHDVTTLRHRGHRHRIMHTTRYQHTRFNTHR